MEQFISSITAGFRGSGAPIMAMIVVLIFICIGLIIERVWFLYFNCGNGKAFLAVIKKYLNTGEIEKSGKIRSEPPVSSGTCCCMYPPEPRQRYQNCFAPC